MLFRSTLDGRPLTVSVRPESMTVGLDTRYVVAVDRGGRLFSVYRDGHTFRRGLNGRVLHKWQDEKGRHWESLDSGQADALVDESYGLLARALDAALRGENLRGEGPEVSSSSARAGDLAGDALREGGRSALAEVLAALESWHENDGCHRLWARRDAERFARLYAPIGILPPDHYLSLVLQATEGCSFNTCTFCDLYHEQYHVKTPEAFARHVADIQAWLGASLSLRRRAVFLGSANALAVPMLRLLPMFDTIERMVAPPGGIAAFLDGFTGARKDEADYRALARRGLRRVYIGLESGHDPLLAFVRKPATRAEVTSTVRAIKAAGVGVGVIVMVGLGGDRFAEGHTRDSVSALNQMDLGRGDLIYFSDLVEMPATAYPHLVAEAGIRALTAAERKAQREAIRGGLRFEAAPPQIAQYDVREFVY